MVHPTLEDAIILATNLHRGQLDKSGQPYILHCLRAMLNPLLQSEEEKIVAVLHDTIEDCGITFKDLHEFGYGNSVIEALGYVTKLPEEEADYEAFINRVITGPIIARKVKLADLYDNADLLRFAKPTEEDLIRAAKYEKAIKKILVTL